MKTTILSLLFCLSLFSGNLLAQKGKDGSPTISGTQIVNEFTVLSSDAMVGATTLDVPNSTLNFNSRFSGNLEAGDLLFIIQMQGPTLNAAAESWAPYYGTPHNASWGAVTAYNNCGNHEFVMVSNVPDINTIELSCGLINEYTANDKVQIIRVPRYEDLTVSASGNLTSETWDGTAGGILAIEVRNNLTVDGTIQTNGLGFRGGIAQPLATITWAGQHAARDSLQGAMKGEGIYGFRQEYNPIGGGYCMGAPANGAGGGNAHNAGGGGGGNAGNVNNWNDGVGNPNPTYNQGWALETPSISGVTSSGGGRGGYTFSRNDENALTLGINHADWAGDRRRNVGGLSGRPLDYSTGKIFMAGGGGAGDMNETYNEGGAGGNGGGIIYILNDGNVSGSGTIESNGNAGEDMTSSSPPLGTLAANDGAGGGGAGGTILINSRGTVGGITLNANGGKGGDQNLTAGGFYFGGFDEAEGPGGGGGGGYIAITNGSPTRNANGGVNGVTDSDGLNEMPPNGATSGGVGLPNESLNSFYVTTSDISICPGATATVTATVVGTLPSGSVITWYDAAVGGNVIGTGTTFTSGAVSTDTAFYVGICPGVGTEVANVTMGGGSLVIDAGSIAIQNENCNQVDGQITGLSVSGGSAPMTYSWNGNSTIGLDTVGLAAGDYTITVTDAGGCVATSGPHTVANTGGPAIDDSGISIADATCGIDNGSISGITVSGGSGALSYDWNGNSSTDADLSNATSGSYTLTVTDGSGCSATSGPHTINMLTSPSIDETSVNVQDEHCGLGNGSITGLMGNGGNGPLSYSWITNSSATADASNLSAGNYQLVVTDSMGCTDTSTVQVVANQVGPVLDDLNIQITEETCGNANGEITGITISGGTAPLSYSWNGNSTLGLDTIGIASGNYSLVVTDANGCSDSLGAYPISNIALSLDTSNVTLTEENCNGGGSITGISVSGGTTPYDFEWNGTSSTADQTGLSAGNYTVVITDAAGCTMNGGTYTIGVVADPSIDTSSMTLSSANCGNSDGSISGITVAGGTAPLSYSWNGANGSIDNSNIPSGTYALVVTDANGCMDSVLVSVSDVAGPTIDISALVVDTAHCGGPTGAISGITFSGGTQPYQTTWNNGGTTNTLQNLSEGFYTLTVIDDNGCSETLDSVFVPSTENVIADFSVSPNPAIVGDAINTTNTSSNNATIWTWLISDSVVSTDENISIPSDTEGTFNICLIATSVHGCVDTMCTQVLITSIPDPMSIPNVFTPNGDGSNDVFKIGNYNNNYGIEVYNRWGNLVFEEATFMNSWDGKDMNGVSVSEGTYYFILTPKLDESEVITGHVMLLR